MNADILNSPFPTCPICHRTDAVKPHKLLRGLLTCQYCRERLVVSWSGHYVRDPFTLKPFASVQLLRRESRPLARLWRDFKSSYPWLLAVLGSAVFLGSALLLAQGSTSESHPPTLPGSSVVKGEK